MMYNTYDNFSGQYYRSKTRQTGTLPASTTLAVCRGVALLGDVVVGRGVAAPGHVGAEVVDGRLVQFMKKIQATF